MQEKIRTLIDKLNYYTKLYDEGHPEISDKEWDNLYFKLAQLEKENNIYYKDSPTQSINFQVIDKLNKVKHNHPMLSLDKTKDIQEIKDFIGNKNFITMLKMDGLTCSLKYEKGKLVSAETRGNGIIGEDILHNALHIKSIPKKIDYQEDLIVDGEIICTYKDFKPFKEEYKNPRNFASGSIRLLDSAECASRNLTFVAWDTFLLNKETLSNKLETLKNYNFTTVPFITESNFQYIEDFIDELKRLSKDLGYPIDGIVFKYNNCKEYNDAGRTDHHFKGGIAYKFYDELYETTLKNIEWTMGRTGVLTPVAILNPIDIDGTEISRASLHNINVMEETLHGTGWKDQIVQIYKANQIIPQIAEAEENKKKERIFFNIPSICPLCGEATEIITEDSGVKNLYCSNENCQGKLINRLEHFFGKKGLDAKGISKATFEKLIDWGWVTKFSDVFELSRYASEWKNVSGFGEKSVSNILQSIEACRNTTFEAVISAAGIPLIGRTVARDLSTRFKTYKDFKEAITKNFDFTEFSGYGYELDKSLKNYNYNELDYIVNHYLKIQENMEEENSKNTKDTLKNLVFCITGKVNIFKNRAELSSLIESYGGRVTGSVSKNTNYLINNDVNSTSAKNKKAKELNIEILDEQSFMNKFDIIK